MLTSLKKVTALAGALAIVAMNVIPATVSAANANPSFALANGVDGLANTADDVVTVTIPNTVLANANTDSFTVVITDSLGAVVDATGKIANGLNIAAPVVTAQKITATKNAAGPATFEFTPGVAGNFGVSVVGTSGVGSAVVYVGNSNVVAVSATVTPTLSMNLSTNSLALGVLDTTGKAASVQVDLSTNANGGAVVNMKSNGLIDTTNNREIGATPVSATTVATSGTDYYKYAINSSAVASWAALTAVSTAAGAGVDAIGTVAATDMPATADSAGLSVVSVSGAGTSTKHVAVGSQIAATTEAGNYSDTLTFTVTGTF